MTNYIAPIFSFWVATILLWIIIIPFFIKALVHFKIGKQIREEATIWHATEFNKLHKKKTWTPTMWWLIILIITAIMVLISVILQKSWLINFSLFNQKETYLTLFTLFSVWVIWAVDDYMNVKWIWRTKWISAKLKMALLILFSGIWAFWFYYKLWWDVNALSVPLLWMVHIGIWFIPLFILVIISTSNSVNITDWLDWLAWGLLLFSYWVYAYITYTQWMFLLSTLCVTIIWALIAFLWFNVKPAKFYMWDVWSLALWANLWVMAMLTNTLFVLLIISAVFIFETLSVIIQLTSKKLRNWKKVFRIAPFHHHLEAIGWAEENVVFRLWLIWLILAVVWIIVYMV